MMKIMIIDDEPDIRTYLMAALEDNGYETCIAEETDPITTTVEKEKPDLILLDIMMPGRSGISIYKELRSTEAFKNIPVALLSGMTSETTFLEDEFRKLIQEDTIALPESFIEKPIQLRALMDLIKRLLKSPHKEK